MNEKLFNFVNKRIKDSYLSKDIVQNVFIKVFLNIESLKNKDKVVSWIFQITRNEINDYFRKQKFDTPDVEIYEIEKEDDNLTGEFSKCMLPMIDLLPEKYKEAIILSEINNLSQKDLAKQLNISYSGAKSRVQRGREQLKSSLYKCCNISADKYGNIIDYNKK